MSQRISENTNSMWLHGYLHKEPVHSLANPHNAAHGFALTIKFKNSNPRLPLIPPVIATYPMTGTNPSKNTNISEAAQQINQNFRTNIMIYMSLCSCLK
jgi:hypothetical protein